MRLPRFVVWIVPVGMMVLGTGMASGQNFPSKPIRIVTSDPGGGSDLTARVIAQGLTANVGQQVVVENRGGGVTAAEVVAKAQPDGYTLLLYGSTIWLAPFLQDRLPYDPVRDFSAVTLAVSSPNVLVVNPSVAANSVKELIALAKARPGELNYASGATGSSNHLAGELLNAMAGVNLVRIPYKGTGPAIIALIGGQVQLMFPNAGAAIPHVKSGKLRALAVTSAQPSALLPGLPAVAASLPGYESVSIIGIFAPAKTPATLIKRLNQEIVRVLNMPDAKDKLFNAGIETIGSSPAQLAAAVKSEMARMGKVIKDAGIRAK